MSNENYAPLFNDEERRQFVEVVTAARPHVMKLLDLIESAYTARQLECVQVNPAIVPIVEAVVAYQNGKQTPFDHLLEPFAQRLFEGDGQPQDLM